MVIFIILLTSLIWLAIGYLFWRSVHYGAVKCWYIEYEEDYSTSSGSRSWCMAMPIICGAGPLNLIIVLFSGLLWGMSYKHGVTFYFKCPAGTPPCKY